eukprot:3030831-Amphidinium_carterae.1
MTRLEHLEKDGVVASDNDMCLAMDARINDVVRAIWNDRDLVGAKPPLADGATLVDQFKRLVEDKCSAHQRLIAELDGRQYAKTQDMEKLGSKLLDRQEELSGEQRREFIKFRSEMQTKVGVDEQKIRKLTEDYLKTATGDKTKQVRIDMYSKALRDVEESQKMLQTEMMKLKESDDGRVLAASKDKERIAHLEATVQELMARQVKEQKSSRQTYTAQSASGTARGRSRGGSQKSQRPKVASQSAQSADSDYVHIESPVPSPRRTSNVMLSGDSAAAFSLGEAQTDGEASMQEEQEKLISLVSTRARLVDGAPRGATEVYTTDDRKFQVGEVVIFTDLEGNVEAHRVKGY